MKKYINILCFILIGFALFHFLSYIHHTIEHPTLGYHFEIVGVSTITGILIGFIFGYFREIYAKNLKESEEKYRTLADTIPYEVQENDLDGTVVYCNEPYVKIIGYPIDEIIGKKKIWDNALTESETKSLKEYFEYLKKEQPEPTPYTGQNKKPNGDIIDVAVDWEYKRNEQGKLIGFVSIITDITELKRAEEALKENEKRLRLILNGLPFVTLLTTKKRKIIAVNQTASNLGIKTGEYCWSSFGRCQFINSEDKEYFERTGKVPPTHPHCSFCMADKCLNDNKIQYAEVLSGGEWYDTYWCPLGDDLLLHYAIPITDKKKIAMELIKAKEQAETANIAKSRFLANISHEIRTPLNSIYGFAQILINRQDKIQFGEKELGYLNMIKIAGGNLTELINNVLDLSKIEAGKDEIKNEEIDIEILIKTVFHGLKSTAFKKGIKFVYNFSNLPQIIFTDRNKLQRILINLISNAIKFTPTNKYINFNSTSTGENLVFEISDEGIGIPEDKLTDIFKPFTQVDNSNTRHYQGTGLGLSITKNLINLLDGKIEVESSLDVGSTFTVTIPIKIIKNRADIKPKIEIASFSSSNTLLVVEDEPMNQQIVEILLKDMGLTIKIAHDGYEAVTLTRRFKPDLVLMDVHMPGMNGIEATKKIRTYDDCKFIPIFGLSADAFDEQKEKGILSGMNGYLTKPLELAKLIPILNKHLK